MALRKQIKELREKKSKNNIANTYNSYGYRGIAHDLSRVFYLPLPAFCCCTTERYYLIFWPQEETYSIVQDSKLVEPKDPAIDEMVKVKEGGKVFVGKVAAAGSKVDVEAQMIELEDNCGEGSPAKTNGELIYSYIVHDIVWHGKV